MLLLFLFLTVQNFPASGLTLEVCDVGRIVGESLGNVAPSHGGIVCKKYLRRDIKAGLLEQYGAPREVPSATTAETLHKLWNPLSLHRSSSSAERVMARLGTQNTGAKNASSPGGSRPTMPWAFHFVTALFKLWLTGSVSPVPPPGRESGGGAPFHLGAKPTHALASA